jgi:hypothetical protein
VKDQDLIFVGMDLETSGSDHVRSALIQVGIANEYGQIYSSYVGGWTFTDSLGGYPDGRRTWTWSDEAEERAHKIPQATIDAARPRWEVDAEARQWIREYVGIVPKAIIAVGWNIAGFDFPFWREYLPQASSSMAYRSVDLNALVFGVTQAGMLRPDGQPWTYYKLKGYVKREAAEMHYARTGGEAQNHDAGYDALVAIYAWDVLKDVLRGDA